MKPDHVFRCNNCETEAGLQALASEICSRTRCVGNGCKALNHCEQCKSRMAKVFEGPGWGNRTWFEPQLNRNLIIDGKPTYVNDIADMKRKFKQMSALNSERRGYDIRYSTEWGDGE